jgi:uncharacterized protein (DUF1778 family)
MPTAATARLNMRIDPEALMTIREAAAAQQQDVTAFVLGAAMDRARTVVRDWHATRLTLVEARRLEALLDLDDAANPELLAMITKAEARRIGPHTYRLPARKGENE